MFFDRLGNAVTGEEPIIEEPIVESYYDPNRPVRPGFEKPEMFQEGIIGFIKRDMVRQTIENYFHMPSIYWNILCWDESNKNGNKNMPSVSKYNGVKIDDKYSIKKMYNMHELKDSCEKIGKGKEMYPIGTLNPSGYICLGKADETLYISDDSYKKKISKFNSFITNIKIDEELSNFNPGSLEAVEKEFGVEFDDSFKSVFNKLIKTKPEAFINSGNCYFIEYESKYQSDFDKKHGYPSIRQFGYKFLDPQILLDWGDDYCDEDGCVCFAYGYPETHSRCAEHLLWVATKSCKKYKPGTIIESWDIPSNAYSKVEEIAPNLQLLIKKSKWISAEEVDRIIEGIVEYSEMDINKTSDYIQEGLFDVFKPKPNKETNLPTTIEDVETMHDIVIDKDFKKFITENPDGCEFKYPDNKIVSKEILEFIDGEDDPTICSLNQFIDANCEYDGCLDIHDYCLYIGGWIDDKALYLATNKSSCAPEGSIIFADVIENGYDYTDRIFAKSFKDFLKNANIEKDINEYSEMDLDEMSDYIQEYVITEANEESKKARKNAQEFMRNEYGTSHPTSMTSKQRNRMKKWLKDNDYDPKTKTIKTDIIDKKTGKNFRVNLGTNEIGNDPMPTPFAITPQMAHESGEKKMKKLTHDGRSYINMPKSYMKRHPSISTGVSKHEEGHVADLQYKRQMAGEKLANAATEYGEKHGLAGDLHSNPAEYKADIYSVTHNKYKDKLRFFKALSSKDIEIQRLAKKRIENGIMKIDKMYGDREYEKSAQDYERIIISSKEDIVEKCQNIIDTSQEMVRMFSEMLSDGSLEGFSAEQVKDVKRGLITVKNQLRDAQDLLKKVENVSPEQAKSISKQHEIGVMLKTCKTTNEQIGELIDAESKLRELVVKTFLKEFATEYDMSMVDVIQEMYLQDMEDYVFQEDFEDEEPFDYDVYLEANEESKKARKNAQEFMRNEYGTSHPTSMTSKQRNRMKKWLKDNDYDPKNGTIATDMKDGGGNTIRVNLGTNSAAGKNMGLDSNTAFNIVSNPLYPKEKYTPAEQRAFAGGRDLINMPKSYMKRHPSISTGISKHEEGHIADYHGKIDDAVDKRLEADEHITQSMKKGVDYSPTHTNVNENIADLYSVRHNKYKDKLRFLNTVLSDDIHMQKYFKTLWEKLCKNVYKKLGDDRPPIIDTSSVETMRDSMKNLVSRNKANIKSYKAQLKTPIYQSGKNLLKRTIDNMTKTCNDFEKILRKWFLGKLLFKKVGYDDAKVEVDRIVWEDAKRTIDEAIRQNDGDIEIRREFLKKYINEFAVEYDMSTTDVIQEMYQTAFEDYVFQEDFEDEEPFDYDVYLEAKIDAAERNELDDDDFGLVYTDENDKEIRKYPLTDKIHIQKAVQFFGSCPDDYKPLLAHNILKKAKKFNIDSSNWDKINKANDKYSDED